MFDIIKHYNYLHQNPELGFEEVNTTNYLYNILNNYEGLEIIRLNPTGLICYTNTNKNKHLLFRSDIDGLPIKEQTNFEYKSLNNNMHACGHDIHMSGLLSFIDYVMSSKDEFKHDFVFVFQPSEEKDGGALTVINHEIMKSFDLVSANAVHVWPQLKINSIATRKGTLLATNKVFKLSLRGTSSHASTPEQANGVLEPMTNIISFTNELCSKHSSVFDPLIINIGKIEGGDVINAVMSYVNISCTMRAMTEQKMDKYFSLLIKYIENICNFYNISYEIDLLEKSYPATINDSNLFDKLVDDNFIILENPSLAVEDFGYYKNICPSIMFLVGTDQGENESLHSSTFLPSTDVINNIKELYIDLLNKYEKF